MGLLRIFLASLIAVLLPLGGTARAQTVSNTAEARWLVGEAQRTARSNTVSFAVDRGEPPVDPGGGNPAAPVAVSMTASRPVSPPGSTVSYTITVSSTDTVRSSTDVVVKIKASPWLSLQTGSVLIDGKPASGAVSIGADGALSIALGTVAPVQQLRITYVMTVSADAPAGHATTRAEAAGANSVPALASADLRIEREVLSARMTLIGRVAAGPCSMPGPRRGIAGVRVVLEDGSFAVTDADGRYHFEGLVPGTHVVQAQAATLPAGGRFLACGGSTRTAGNPASRFIIGQGGSLAVADFVAEVPETAAGEPAKTGVRSDREAAGGDVDWLAQGPGPIDFLFPAVDHNPRAPAVRVVIRHLPGQAVTLSADGKPVDPHAFDGTRAAAGGSHAISAWRAIPIGGETLRLAAVVRNRDGSVAAELSREVAYAATPARAEIVAQASRLVADGVTRPVIAVRIVDRRGRPVHAGISGEFAVNSPYESAQALDAMQTRLLAGLQRTAPRWQVKGDDGIAYLELAPTMVSGALRLDFVFADREVRREQRLDGWIAPGDQKWTLVGLAEGSAGARLREAIEHGDAFDSDLGQNGRIAFYAKGRVLGRFLLTAAYDSARQKADQRLLGAIDPNAYYTVFADGSDRRFDAASREKLYVRIETATFHALYGDFSTGFDQTRLTRYQRTATGLKAELASGRLRAQAFAARIAGSHRRDEIQGAGISGPYRLSNRAIVPNSETVTIEVRDRFRSEVIVERRPLTRFIDYDIDVLTGSITLSRPLLSTDAALNPQILVVDFEVTGGNGGKLNAGLRGEYTSSDGKVRLGITAIRDEDERRRTDIAGLDIKVRPTAATEIRAEAAASIAPGRTARAWLVEVEHHDRQLDLLAYARTVEAAFGTGQVGNAEAGRRKLGLDARYRLDERWSVTGSAWRDQGLTDGTARTALQLRSELSTERTDLRLALSRFADTLRDGSAASSTVLEAGATRRLFDNRLELDAATSLALGATGSVDLPARHRFGLRYALSDAVKLIGSFEIAEGDAISARTARFGIEASPWRGARVQGTLGRQVLGEYGPRAFAAFGLAQSFDLGKNFTVDATIDSSRTIGGVDPVSIVNPAHPVAGRLGDAGTAEDFVAATLGAAYRSGRWSATVRGEWRDGDLAQRTGLSLGAIRQLGEGAMVGAGFVWTRATTPQAALTETLTAAVSAAHRPADAPFAFLTKLEYRADRVENAVAGEVGGAGRSLFTVNGDALSRRLIASFSGNWTPRGQAAEIGLFLATRYGFDLIEGQDLGGWSALAGLDARISLTEWLDVGAAGTLRHSFGSGASAWSLGPQLGLSPTRDVLLMVGYNFAGYPDRDFAAARGTDRGLFASLRMKFDADSLGFLGLDR